MGLKLSLDLKPPGMPVSVSGTPAAEQLSSRERCSLAVSSLQDAAHQEQPPCPKKLMGAQGLEHIGRKQMSTYKI